MYVVRDGIEITLWNSTFYLFSIPPLDCMRTGRETEGLIGGRSKDTSMKLLYSFIGLFYSTEHELCPMISRLFTCISNEHETSKLNVSHLASYSKDSDNNKLVN